jgi:hypothetical protein
VSDLFECASCHKRREKPGSGLRLILGLQSRVCLSCRTEIDNRRGVMPKPKRRPTSKFVIAADGKRRPVPTKNQATFSVTGHAVIPTVVASHPGFDTRYQVDPTQFKGGEFSRLGVGHYVEE